MFTTDSNLQFKEPFRGSFKPRLKRDTIAKIYYAKEILQARLENPPLLSELAQQVGVSETTLQKGFQMQFGTTVFGYLTNQRMEQAYQLLKNSALTVAEVANIVGYFHLGHFAVAPWAIPSVAVGIALKFNQDFTSWALLESAQSNLI